MQGSNLTPDQKIFLGHLFRDDLPMSGDMYLVGMKDLILSGVIWHMPANIFEEACMLVYRGILNE